MKILSVIVFFFCGSIMFAQSGTTDATFGNSGKVIIDLGNNDICNKVVSDSAGNIFFAGGRGIYNGTYDYDYCIGKLLPDGTLDNNFATSGVLTGDFPGYSSSIITDFFITNDFIYAIGNGYEFGIPDSQSVFLSRFTLNGIQDSSFGNNGIYSPPIPASYSSSGKVSITSDNKILFTGNYLDTS